jgi:hypothetical protein
MMNMKNRTGSITVETWKNEQAVLLREHEKMNRQYY